MQGLGHLAEGSRQGIAVGQAAMVAQAGFKCHEVGMAVHHVAQPQPGIQLVTLSHLPVCFSKQGHVGKGVGALFGGS